MANSHIGNLHPSGLIVATRKENNVAQAVDKWLFAEQPQDLSEHLRKHVPGNRLDSVVMRTVEPFTMANARSVFAQMSEGSNITQQIFHIKGDELILSDLSVSVSFANDLVCPPPPDSMPVPQMRKEKPRRSLNPFKSTPKYLPFVPAGAKYAALTAVIIKYRPLTTMFSTAGRLEITLWDHGVATEAPVAAVSLSRTGPANILLGSNYMMLAHNLGRLELRIEVSLTGMRPGQAWGVAEMAFAVTFGAKPFPLGVTHSVVQYELPSDLFIIHAADPAVFNAELSQKDLDTMRAMQGDIPVLSAGELSNMGVLVKKGMSPGPDYPVFGGIQKEEPTLPWLQEDPFNTASLPSPSTSSQESFPRELSTATLTHARDRLAMYEAALARHRATQTNREGTAGRPPASGLPGIVRTLIGVEIDDTCQCVASLPPDVVTAGYKVDPGNSIVYMGDGALPNTSRISSVPFLGGTPLPLATVFAVYPTTIFTTI